MIYDPQPTQTAIAYIHYTHDQQSQLIALLLEHGVQQPRFDVQGMATIPTLVQNDPSFIYLKPDSWLRCLATGWFMAHSQQHFSENYTLV